MEKLLKAGRFQAPFQNDLSRVNLAFHDSMFLAILCGGGQNFFPSRTAIFRNVAVGNLKVEIEVCDTECNYQESGL